MKNKNSNKKNKTMKIKKLTLTVMSVILLIIISCTTCFATEGSCGVSDVYIYIMFIIVTEVAVAEGVYIAYLKIFKLNKNEKKNEEKK